MPNTVTREMYLPENAVPVTEDGVNAVAYIFNNKAGKPCAIAFKGRSAKPKFNFYFQTEEARDLRVAKFLGEVKKVEDEKKARRAAASQPHDIEVGTIMYTSWGVEQTNVTFYEVVEVPSNRSVVVEEIGRQTDPNRTADPMAMACYVVPDATIRTGNKFRKTVDTGGYEDRNSIAISRYETAWVLDMNQPAKYCSWYA